MNFNSLKQLFIMNNYFKSKLFEINYRMATHEGEANRRLASEAHRILVQLVPELDNIPAEYRQQFYELSSLLQATINDLPQSGQVPVKLKGIKNVTAAKYLALLLDLQLSLEGK